MSNIPLSTLDEAFTALENDLLAEGGAQISTTPNYRFAILPYHPTLEFALRDRLFQTTRRLGQAGWVVLTVDLQHLLFERLERTLGAEGLERIMMKERRARRDEQRLNLLRRHICPIIEGADGLASDVVDRIQAFCDAHPDQADRTVVFVGRAGALYPLFRTSALLKHLDGATGRGHAPRVPIVLLYPGTRETGNALSFMGELPADSDYRPRIYPERLS
jgi:hypothetical protein